MKPLNNNFRKFLMHFAIVLFAIGFTSCSNDDDDVRMDLQPTGTLTVQDQTISQNMITIESVTVGQDSWIVVRNAGQEGSAAIVSEPVFLEEGTHQNVRIPLTNTANLTGNEDGDDLVVMLHADTGTLGTFDYTGQNNNDRIITTTSGANVAETINVRGPRLEADDDQMVTENNEVTFSTVSTGNNGWIILYGQNEDGTINENEIIGRRFVEAGDYTDFTVPFDEGYSYIPGSTIFPRLYMDDPADEEFTFVQGGDEDLPELYGFDEATGQGMFVGNTSTTGGFTIQ